MNAVKLDSMTSSKTRLGGLRQAAVFTFLFGLAAHGFRFFRLDFAHDATMVFQNDDLWQIQLGRFLMPVYARMRGQLVAPAWVGLLALSFLSLAVWLVCRLLRLERPWAVALTAGLMATSASLTLSNASYLPWSDIYMLSLLCAVGAVSLWKNWKWGFLPAMVLLGISLALYPSYVQATAFLMLAVLAGDCLQEVWNWKATVVRGLRALAALMGGLLLYAGSYHAVLAALGAAAGTAPNSVSHIADLLGADWLALLGAPYRAFWSSLVSPVTTFQPAVAAVMNVLWLVSVIPALVLALRPLSRQVSRYVLLAVVLVLMPLGIGCIYFLAMDYVHELMTYPMILAPVACLALWHKVAGEQAHRWVRLGRQAVCVVMAALIFCSAAFANQVYLKQALKADSTLSTFTRLIDRIEQTPGYRCGETPVVLIGGLGSGDLAMERPGLDELTGTGLWGYFSVTYYGSYDAYFKQVLSYPINLVIDRDPYAQLPQVQALGTFPASDCTVLLPDGTLVVRLS